MFLLLSIIVVIMKQWQFQKNSSLLEFHTTVRSCALVRPQTYGVILEDTIFSPEGDGGTMNELAVQEVTFEQGEIVHYVDSYSAPGSVVLLHLDWKKREHIVAHTTARTLLGHVVAEVTKSFITAYGITEKGGFVDIKRDVLNPSEIRKIFHEMHAHIAAHAAIKVFGVPHSQALEIYRKHRVYLEDTRDEVLLVEIQGLGVFPYLGMVSEHTGMLGVLVMEGWEKREGKIRLHFSAGTLARHRVVDQSLLLHKITQHLHVGEREIMDTLKQKQEEFSVIATEYNKSFQEFLRQELQKIDEHAPVVVNFYKEISHENLKLFAEKAIELYPSKIFVFFSHEGVNTHYICRGPQNSRYDMQQLSQFIARCIQGKGEGTANVAEGHGLGELSEDELVHMCATFLQNYRLHRPRISRKLPEQHVQPHAEASSYQ